MTRRGKLRLLRWLLRRVDSLICGLSSPAHAYGRYFEAWGALGHVHGVIGTTDEALTAAINQEQQDG